MLELRNISAGYGKKQVLFNISLEIKKHEFVLLVGSNGSGKSTLLRRIYSLVKGFDNETGEIFFKGSDITNRPAYEMTGTGIAYIPQKNNYYEAMTVDENLDIAGLMIKNRKERKQRKEEVLECFELLKPLLKRSAAKLSGGERQLMVLVCAMQNKPEMLLLDEPFTGLAGRNIELVKEQLAAIHKRGVTMLMVEHRIKETLPLADKVYGLKLGTISEVPIVQHEFDEQLFSKILI